MVIVTGTGEKSFSAGFDVGDVANAEEVGPKGQTTWSRVNRFPKPIIAATNGSALDGGCEPALACHFRIMVDKPKALIGLSELNFGIIPGWGGTQRMLRTLGRSKALDMILFSKRITAKEALSIELIDKVSAPGEALNDALQMAQVIAERLPIAVSAVLKAMTLPALIKVPTRDSGSRWRVLKRSVSPKTSMKDL